MKNKKFQTQNYAEKYFSGIEDEILSEMAYQFPIEFRKMCILMCLDFQMQKESYEKENSNSRGNVC